MNGGKCSNHSFPKGWETNTQNIVKTKVPYEQNATEEPR